MVMQQFMKKRSEDEEGGVPTGARAFCRVHAQRSKVYKNADKIIADLISTVQPQKQPRHIDDFSNQSIDIDVWEPQMESSFLTPRITIMVQTQTRTNDLHWTGPLMSPDMLQQHNTRMVAVWKTGLQSAHSYHAVYANKCLHASMRGP